MNTTENRNGKIELEEDRLDTVCGGNFLTDWWDEKVRDVADWVLDLRAKGGITHPAPHPRVL